MSQLKTIIVDDKWLVRSELKFLLKQYPSIHIVGEAGTMDEAIKLITDEKPDAVFLDIQLPENSGFDLLDKLDIDFQVIFISAFKKYMNEAKKYNPIEFLLKPINVDKLSKTINKLEKAVAIQTGH